MSLTIISSRSSLSVSLRSSRSSWELPWDEAPLEDDPDDLGKPGETLGEGGDLGESGGESSSSPE